MGKVGIGLASTDKTLGVSGKGRVGIGMVRHTENLEMWCPEEKLGMGPPNESLKIFSSTEEFTGKVNRGNVGLGVVNPSELHVPKIDNKFKKEVNSMKKSKLDFIKSFFCRNNKFHPPYFWITILMSIIVVTLILRLFTIANLSDTLIIGLLGFVAVWVGMYTTGKIMKGKKGDSK